MTARFRPAWLERHRVDLSSLSRTEIVGIGHVTETMDSLAALLRDPERAAAMGIELPRGILLHGDPGLGKTLAARALAHSLGPDIPFYEVSADELTPERIRGALRHLAAAHPRSVLYLDEVDTFGMARDYMGHDPDTRLLLTATLAALDGLVATPGPVVIASSNRSPVFLDPALVRAGRLGVRVQFDPPNEEERVALFVLFSRTIPLEEGIDWTHAARLTRGMSPASLRQIVSDAAALALADGRSRLGSADMSTAIARDGQIEPQQDLVGQARARMAAHESGHVAVAVVLRGAGWVYSVRIGPLGGRSSLGNEEERQGDRSDDETRDLLVAGYGGIAAEVAVLGEGSSAATSDISEMTGLALERIAGGLTGDDVPLDLDRLGRNVAESLKVRLAAELVDQIASARSRAIEIVQANIEPIRSFAASLNEAGELTGAALADAIEVAGFHGVAGDAE